MRGWMGPCLVLSLRIRFDICHTGCSEMYSVHAQCLAGKVGAAKNNKCVVLLGGLWGFRRLFGRVGSRACDCTVLRMYNASEQVWSTAYVPH